jgi:hypothetical protein
MPQADKAAAKLTASPILQFSLLISQIPADLYPAIHQCTDKAADLNEPAAEELAARRAKVTGMI